MSFYSDMADKILEHIENNNFKLPNVLAEVEKQVIVLAIYGAGWNVARAANYLGMNRTTLQMKLQAMGVERPGAPKIEAKTDVVREEGI